MKNYLVTCDNEKEFWKVKEKFNGDDSDFVWHNKKDKRTIRIADGVAEAHESLEWYDADEDYDNHKRVTAKEILNLQSNKKPKKITMSKKTYTTKVEVEKRIKFTLPKYTIGQPIHVDFNEHANYGKPLRITILPFRAMWDYDNNENLYQFIDNDREVANVRESYINRNIIKA